ncbi:sodium channel protein Nach-like [Bradysia coprophila]|uniref:sodium channel protein Nach-like n=1 Tax=Bradysia coprophila TaxID=38358 RepID=UPI00187DBA3F|nr:sodium channel protein Nach-like [Bradysia coprophila]
MTFVELNLSQAKEKSKKPTKHMNKMTSILHHQNGGNNLHGDSKLNEYSKSKNSTNGRISKSRLSHPRISFSKNIFDVRGHIFLEGLTQTTLSFCRETTLHGMKYIVADIEELGSTFSKQKRLRKLISLTVWASAVIVGAVFAIVLMGLVWNRFQTTPTITTVETNNYPIWNLPFPAVTICNINKVYAPAAQNITDKLIEKGLEKEGVLEFLENLAKLITPEYIDALYLKTYQILEEMGYTTDKLMFELMQPCNLMIKSCAWLGKIIPCDTIFRVAKSSEGFCCSFNYKALKDSLEINTASDTVNDQLSSPIYRVTGAGENVGLSARIHVDKESYVAYSKSFYGAKVLIHDPEDFPQTEVTTSIGQPGYDLAIAVLPSVIVSQPQIRGLPQLQRNCLFEDEKKLRTTNKYSFQSCMNECTVDTILAKCDCLPFYYPESDIRVYAKRYRQCSLHDVKCLRDNRHIFSSLQPPANIDALNETNLGMQCSCLPSCSEHRYEVQTILSRRYPEDKLNSTTINQKLVDLHEATTLSVHFKDLTCIKYRRDMYMTWDGLLAAFGGIFGLCLGGSVLSLVEMVYYFTLRLFNRVVAIIQKDQPPTRQVSPVKKHKPNYSEKQSDFAPLKKSTMSDSKLQTFGKNIIEYEPFTVRAKGVDAFKKLQSQGHNNTFVGERFYLK